MKKLLFPAALVAATLACGGDADEAPSTPTTPPAEAPPAEAPAEAPAAEAAPEATASNPALLDPSKLTEEAPATYTVELDTTAGPIVIDVTRELAPKGADRFYNLVKNGFYDDTGFFRVVPGFVVQIGIHGDPKVSAAWNDATITDDPVKSSNTKGTVTFATAGPDTRTTQIFINLADNANLDGMGFAPFGKVKDMAAVEKIDSSYGEQPIQPLIETKGNAYLKTKFPNMTFVKKATIKP